jgi:hypothetical protein
MVLSEASESENFFCFLLFILLLVILIKILLLFFYSGVVRRISLGFCHFVTQLRFGLLPRVHRSIAQISIYCSNMCRKCL